MTKHAVVTGAYGFVGRHVARALARSGYIVTGIGHGKWQADDFRGWGLADWHDADVCTDTLAMYAGSPDLLIHCAGSGSVAYSLAHPRQDFERSALTTLAVLDFARNLAPRTRLVLASSAGVYGAAKELPISVDSSLCPVSPYGLHKKIAEELFCSYGRHFDIRVAVVRLFSIYGPGLRKQLLWDACSKLARSEIEFDGTGAETRDWIHVEDAADLLIRAGECASSSGLVVNGGTGVSTSTASIVTSLARLLSPNLMPTFSGRMRAGDPQHYMADIETAKGLGWEPRQALCEGLAAYVEWFRKGAP